jgi:hypothetical protein
VYEKSIQSVDDGFPSLCSVVMIDETWCFLYDTQTKRQSIERHLPSSTGHKQFLLLKKMVLVTFCNSRGIIHK